MVSQKQFMSPLPLAWILFVDVQSKIQDPIQDPFWNPIQNPIQSVIQSNLLKLESYLLLFRSFWFSGLLFQRKIKIRVEYIIRISISQHRQQKKRRKAKMHVCGHDLNWSSPKTRKICMMMKIMTMVTLMMKMVEMIPPHYNFQIVHWWEWWCIDVSSTWE